MTFDHVCIAVRSIDKSIDRLCKVLGYSVKTEKISNTRQQVNVQFITKSGSMDIKLIEPSDKHSPLINFLKKGEGLHHICFMSDDMGETILDMTSHGGRLLAGPEPGEAFDDEDIAFLFAGSGLNVEIIDTKKRRGLKDADKL